MANPVHGIFSRPLFSGDKATQQRQAAEGLSQVFAAILSRQMRQSMVGEDKGPLGIGGGTSGSIYGSFMDDAMSKLLAHSPAMRSLNQALERQIAGPQHATAAAAIPAGKIRALESLDRVLFTAAIRDETAVPRPHAIAQVSPEVSPVDALDETGVDARGPRLLPPAPDTLAPNLPPPFSLKG